jgi:uncharacterized protein (TIGR02145 family)
LAVSSGYCNLKEVKLKILKNMRKKAIFWMLALVMMSAASVNAQVTIGSVEDPHGGAVLDLSKASGSSIGFLLPRIALTNVDTWQIGGDKAQGSGMLVYNTNSNVAGGDGIGIYIWNGSVWKQIKTGVEDICPRVVKDAENNTYSTGWFGAAGCWMTQNLRTQSKAYVDGTVLAEGFNGNGDYTSKYYNYPNGDQEIFAAHPEYGLLYSWAAASGRTTTTANEPNDANQTQYQGICPSGWHLPSDYEWNQLEKTIAESGAGVYSTSAAATWNDSYNTSTGYRGDAHGRKMKSATVVVNNTNPPNGESNTHNADGFDAMIVGFMFVGFADMTNTVYYWTASSYDDNNAWMRGFTMELSRVARSANVKYGMFPIRCKKN